MKYKTKNHFKYRLSVHIILCVKYRKPLLDRFGDEIKQYVLDISDGKRFSIDVLEVDNNHLHALVDFEPSCSIGYIIKTLKSGTTTKLWSKHSDVLKQHFWKRKVLWSSGYFACSVGGASVEKIKEYIENQG